MLQLLQLIVKTCSNPESSLKGKSPPSNQQAALGRIHVCFSGIIAAPSVRLWAHPKPFPNSFTNTSAAVSIINPTTIDLPIYDVDIHFTLKISLSSHTFSAKGSGSFTGLGELGSATLPNMRFMDGWMSG